MSKNRPKGKYAGTGDFNVQLIRKNEPRIIYVKVGWLAGVLFGMSLYPLGRKVHPYLKTYQIGIFNDDLKAY